MAPKDPNAPRTMAAVQQQQGLTGAEAGSSMPAVGPGFHEGGGAAAGGAWVRPHHAVSPGGGAAGVQAVLSAAVPRGRRHAFIEGTLLCLYMASRKVLCLFCGR